MGWEWYLSMWRDPIKDSTCGRKEELYILWNWLRVFWSEKSAGNESIKIIVFCSEKSWMYTIAFFIANSSVDKMEKAGGKVKSNGHPTEWSVFELFMYVDVITVSFLLNSIRLSSIGWKQCRGGLRFIGLFSIFSVFHSVYRRRVFILVRNDSIGKIWWIFPGKFGFAFMLRADGVEMNCLLIFKGQSEALLRRLTVGVAILKQMLCMLFSLSKRVDVALIYKREATII